MTKLHYPVPLAEWVRDAAAVEEKRRQICAVMAATEMDRVWLLMFAEAKAGRGARGGAASYVVLEVEPGFATGLREELALLIEAGLLPAEWTEWIPKVRGASLKIPRAAALAVGVTGWALWRCDVRLGQHTDPFLEGMFAAIVRFAQRPASKARQAVDQVARYHKELARLEAEGALTRRRAANERALSPRELAACRALGLEISVARHSENRKAAQAFLKRAQRLTARQQGS